MSEIIFPNNPHNGYEFVVGNVTYIWDGTKWVSDGPSAAGSGATGPDLQDLQVLQDHGVLLVLSRLMGIL